MDWIRAIGISVALGCAAVSAEEAAWRKTESKSPVAAQGTSRPAVWLGRPMVAPARPAEFQGAAQHSSAFRKVRGQSPEEFRLPPEYWPSTLGTDVKKAALPPPADTGWTIDRDPPSSIASTSAEEVGPAETIDPAPAAFPAPPPVRLNPWTGLPWGAVIGEMNGSYYRVADWLVPADEMYQPPHRLSVEGEYLLWWTKGSNFPPLVSTDSPTTPQFRNGAPPMSAQDIFGGQGSLPPAGIGTVIYGGQQSARLQSGARFSVVYWLGDCGDLALDADYFFLSQRSNRFSANTDQFPVLTRPFINALSGQESRELVSTPGIAMGDVFKLRGTVSVEAPSSLSGWDLGIRKCLCSDLCWNVEGLVGFKHMDLDEGLFITEDIVSAQAVAGTNNLDPGNRIFVFDRFRTENQFNGGYVGIRGEYRKNRWFVQGRTRIALGNTHQTVIVDGGQVITRLTGERQTFVGGLLASPTNIGLTSQNRFTVIPEVGIKVGYQITDNLRAHVGYDFIYWSSVLRPGDQVDRRVNPFLVPNLIIGGPNPPPGPRLPRVPMQTTDYWAQGMNFGLEWRY